MKQIVCFVGRHDTGKTTLLTHVIPFLKKAGLRVAVIKHAHHSLQIEDSEDSGRLFTAGADLMIAVSPDTTLQYQRQKEPELSELLTRLPGETELVILEGYKESPYPKIEVLREETGREPLGVEHTIAYVSDFSLPTDLPVFTFEQVREISAFILDYFKNS